MRATHGVESWMSSGQCSRVAGKVGINSCIWLVISGFLVCEGLISVLRIRSMMWCIGAVPKLMLTDRSGE